MIAARASQASATPAHTPIKPIVAPNTGTSSSEQANAASELRLTVATPEDLELIRRIHGELAPTAATPYAAIVALLRREPDLIAINAAIEQRSAHHHDPRVEVGRG